MKKSILLLLVVVFPVLLTAHGVRYTPFSGGVGIEAHYDEGSAISFAKVKIYRPGEKKSVFQQGITDEHGRFMFAPDTAGDWTIEIDDGLGHGLIETIAVSKSLELTDSHHHGLARWQQIAVGMSIIFGITGIGFYITARKMS